MQPMRPNPLLGGARFAALPPLRKAVLGVGFVCLLPLRIAGIGALLLVVHAVLALGYCWCCRPRHATRPVPAWKRCCVRWWYKLAARAGLCNLGYWPCGCIKIKGRENLTKAACDSAIVPTVVANHLGLIEPLILDWLIGGAVTVADQATTAHWYLTAVNYAKQAIGFDRADKSQASAVGQDLVRRAKEEKGQWNQILIFPEGTCGNGLGLNRFKPGAFAAGTPVLPIVIEFPVRERGAPWERHADSVPFEAWVYGNDSGTSVFLRLLSRLWNRVTITILPVHHPTPEEAADPKVYARAVETEMALALGVGNTPCSGDDVSLMGVAGRVGLPYDEACLGCAGLWKLHGSAAHKSVLVNHVRAFANGRQSRDAVGWDLSDWQKWSAANGALGAEGVDADGLARYFATVVARRGEGRGAAAEGAAESILRLRDYVHNLALPATSRVEGVVVAVHAAVHAACAAAALAVADGASVGGESLSPPPPPQKSRERVESGSASAKVAPVVRTPSPTASGSDENV
jgi:hypothetical protein